MAFHTERNHVLNFQERVQQLDKQLKEMEREKEKELTALRKEKRELVHTRHNQTVRGIYSIMDVINSSYILLLPFNNNQCIYFVILS